MESIELAVLIISLVLALVVLFVLVVFIKRKCCRGKLDNQHSPSTNNSQSRTSTFPRDIREVDYAVRGVEYSTNDSVDNISRSSWGRYDNHAYDYDHDHHVPVPVSSTRQLPRGSGTLGKSRRTYAAATATTGYRLENERFSRPTPYVISNNDNNGRPHYPAERGAHDTNRPTHAVGIGYRAENERCDRRTPYVINIDQDSDNNGEARQPATASSQRIPLPTPVPISIPKRNRRNKRRGKHQSTTVVAKSAISNQDNDDDVDNIILAMQGNLREDSKANETIAEVQNLLILNTDNSNLISEDCRLIIGVDATPAAQAGYCVNLKEKRLCYYVIKRDDLPWVLHDPKDPSEFEMKNFMFALTVWEGEILKFKRMRIYTDNFAITKAKCFDDKKYGERAFQVLRHYNTCKSVAVLNIKDMAVNRFKNLKHFAKFIQPADDLSRWRISEAIEFLTKLYGIDQENVQGTHYLDLNHKRPSTAKAWYKPTERYREILRYANNIITCHDCPNSTCLGSDLLQASLRIKK